MGGDCLNFGCVPSKALLRAARAWSEAREAESRYGGPRVIGPGDFSHVMERMRRIRAEISSHDSAERFRQLGVDVFLGTARFDSPRSVRVGGNRLRFGRAIIAAGSRPRVPEIPGLAGSGFLTTHSVFSLTELPARLVVLGGGAVGVELAQAFARLGSRVTLVETADRILAEADADAAAVVRRALEADGVGVHCAAELTRVERQGAEVRALVLDEHGSETLRCDALLVAIGRSPNIEDLDLGMAAISSRADGIVTDRRLRTSNRRVFAVGDVTIGPRFTHVADAHARIAVRNALFWGRARADEIVVPWSVFTEPELAHVGINSADADEQRDEVETLTLPADAVDRPRLDGDVDGFLRLHLRRADDTILGATVVHPRAGDLIAFPAQAIASRTPLGAISEMIFPYPTSAELFRRAADMRRRERLTPRVRRLFALYFRLRR
jgi:pyruvate/2-oxoglutarate dehydrogenase complex dihydrolipoamide dehydrogenase (E3) component